jgi:hypothetical protein
MEPPAVGGDGGKEMCKHNSRGKQKWKVSQQATSDGFA